MDSECVMKKIMANDPETLSADVLGENIEYLKSLFPEACTEGKIDFGALKQLLGGRVDEREEKYGLNWYGKRQARQLALTPSTGTLRPCPADSVDWDTTQNLMIEGDNLEVLKLLQKSYAGKVKLIYIDPPYNTGKDFVYPDDYRDNIRNYLELTGQVDGENRKFSSNTEASGRFHTDWLNMMYPRLKLARNLLRRDGAIFASIDEAEHTRLRVIMDEIFGQENFIADMVWAAGRKNDSKLISVSHEYIVCYARDHGHLREEKISWRQRKKGLEDIYAQYGKLKKQHDDNFEGMTKALKQWYKDLPDNHPAKAHRHYSQVDSRGIYFPADISWPGGGGPKYKVLHPATKRPVKVPSRGWMTSDPKKMQHWIEDDRVHFGPDETKVPCIKSYLGDREYQTPYSVFYQDGRAASKRLRSLMDSPCFDYPKDEEVLGEIVGMMTFEEDICVDCFAGSGTFFHSVMAQNALDNYKRRCFLVQLPECLDPRQRAQRIAADFCNQLGKPHTIAELTKERLRRTANKIKDENPSLKGDLGFRVFKLDTSNIRAWEPSTEDLGDTLFDNIDHIKPDRSEGDILYELLLKLGLDLCVPSETRTIVGKNVHSIGVGTLMACLDKKICREDVEALSLGIVEWHKELSPAGDSTVVFRDSAFADDVAKTNLAAILEQHGLGNVRSL